MRIPSEHASGPEDETLVPCPCCAKGMVSHVLAAKVRKCLSNSAPPPTDDMLARKEKE